MRKRFLIFAVLILLISGITVHAAEKKLPACTNCGMDIPDNLKKFSVIQRAGKKVIFCDIGCAIQWRAKQCTSIQMTFDGAAKTYDYNTGEPVSMQDAVYVKDSGVETPMGFGIIAFKSKADAESFIKKAGKGKLLTYDELIQLNLQ